MEKITLVSLEAGINPVSKDIDVSKFRKNKVTQVVFRSKKGPKNYIEDNPNPADKFLGKDGKWYTIGFPSDLFNCYLFAMGWTVKAKNSGYGIPGFLVGKLPRNQEEIKEYIIEDLAAVGRKVHEILSEDEIPEELPAAEKGTYWVKIYFYNEGIGSFHIARKDEQSGRWVHKLGWTAPCKVICDNLELGTDYDAIIEENPELKSLLKTIPREMFMQYASEFGHIGIVKSRWEDRDNAIYKAYDSEKSPNDFITFVPKWVMRIDE